LVGGAARRHTQRADAASSIADAWSARWASLLLIATILFLLIGPNPYMHENLVDPDTGGSVLSPLNRYAWFVLTGFAAPLIWFKRSALADLLLRLWPLLMLFTWFAVTTTWALDPPTSQRRLSLLFCQTIICAACCLGLRDARSMHRALAASCAIIVLIDLASWVALPKVSQTEIGLAAIHNHKNSLGLAMMFAEFVCAPFIFTQTTWRGKLFWGFIVVAAAALLVASKSKTSLNITLAALVMTPVILVILRGPRLMLLSALASALVLISTAALIWLSVCYVQGNDPLWPIRHVTFTQRTDVWTFVLSQIALRPFSGAGFASFWDINPAIQPSLQTDLWFAQPDSPTNEAHDGYLDLLVTTGFMGLAITLFVLLRWMGRGLSLLRRALRSSDGQIRVQLPYLIFLGLFPILIALHNFLESSYFNTVGLFSFMVLFMGIDVDLRAPTGPVRSTPR